MSFYYFEEDNFEAINLTYLSPIFIGAGIGTFSSIAGR
jgi:hypothetical protein